MEDLLSKKCLPCEGGTPPLGRAEAETYLAEAPGWQLAEDEKAIFRAFKWKDFREAMAFVHHVAELAESEGHHPNIHISWNRVTLELTTHAIGGLSENDFIMAAKINPLAHGDTNGRT